jgi:hypothetical protein
MIRILLPRGQSKTNYGNQSLLVGIRNEVTVCVWCLSVKTPPSTSAYSRRKDNSMSTLRLSKSEVFRLYGVSVSPNESGEYQLEAFNDDAFNQDIDAEDLNETLNGLADATYGQGSRWYEVTDDSFDDNGKVCIEISDSARLAIQDISGKVDTDPDHSRFYLLVDAQLSEFCWVVAEPTGAVYSG